MGQCFQLGGLRISAFADDVVELSSSAGVLQLTLEQDKFLPKVEDFKCLRVLFTSDGSSASAVMYLSAVGKQS